MNCNHRTVDKRWFIPIVLWFVCHSQTYAQYEQAEAVQPGHPPVMSAARPPNARTIESELGNLIDATKRVGNQLRSSGASTAPQDDGFRAKLFDKPSRPTEPADGVNQIRERIRLLRRLRDRDEIASPGISGDAPQPAGNSTTHRRNPVRPEIQPTLSEIENNLTERERPVEETPQKVVSKINARKILSGPVSHLALGQSLYRTKNYSAALKALQQVDTTELTDSDRAWLDLLVAMCHRRLGMLDIAEASLRELANAKSTDYPVSVARYWLNQSQVIRDSKDVAELSTAQIDALIQRSKQYANQ